MPSEKSYPITSNDLKRRFIMKKQLVLIALAFVTQYAHASQQGLPTEFQNISKRRTYVAADLLYLDLATIRNTNTTDLTQQFKEAQQDLVNKKQPISQVLTRLTTIQMQYAFLKLTQAQQNKILSLQEKFTAAVQPYKRAEKALQAVIARQENYITTNKYSEIAYKAYTAFIANPVVNQMLAIFNNVKPRTQQPISPASMR